VSACRWRNEVREAGTVPRTVRGTDASLRKGDDDQIIRISPAELALSAGVTVNVYSLARAIESEWGHGPIPGLFAVGETIRNHAGRVGRSVSDVLLAVDDDVAPKEREEDRGFYGRQRGRYAATSISATDRSIAVAEAVLEKDTQIAGGAGKFFHPYGFGGKIVEAIETYDRWVKEGWRFVSAAPLYVDWCVDPLSMFLLGQSRDSVGVASILQGRRILENG